MRSPWAIQPGAEGAVGAGVRVLAVGLEGADQEQLRRMVSGEDPRFVFHNRGSLSELEGELTDDLCTIISTRVREWGLPRAGDQTPWSQGLLLPHSHLFLLSHQPEPEPKPCTVQCPRVSIPGPWGLSVSSPPCPQCGAELGAAAVQGCSLSALLFVHLQGEKGEPGVAVSVWDPLQLWVRAGLCSPQAPLAAVSVNADGWLCLCRGHRGVWGSQAPLENR